MVWPSFGTSGEEMLPSTHHDDDNADDDGVDHEYIDYSDDASS